MADVGRITPHGMRPRPHLMALLCFFGLAIPIAYESKFGTCESSFRCVWGWGFLVGYLCLCSSGAAHSSISSLIWKSKHAPQPFRDPARSRRLRRSLRRHEIRLNARNGWLLADRSRSCAAVPRLWDRIERFDTGPDYRSRTNSARTIGFMAASAAGCPPDKISSWVIGGMANTSCRCTLRIN